MTVRAGNLPLSTLDNTDHFLITEGEAPRRIAYDEVKENFIGTETLTTTSQTVKGAINELDADLGEKSQLPTTDKTNVVNSIVEINGILSEKVNPNILVNGGLSVWQRGTSFTGAQSYTADRWNWGHLNTSDTLIKFEDGLKISASANGRHSFCQSLELTPTLVGAISGKKVTLSFWIKADASFIAKCGYAINTLNDDTNNVQYNVTNVYTKQTITINVPTLNFTDTFFTITPFRIDTLIQAQLPTTNIYIKNIKLEIGDKATPFVPRLLPEEKTLSNYIYERIGKGLVGVGISSTTIQFTFHFTEKRSIPIINLLSSSIAIIPFGSADIPFTGITLTMYNKTNKSCNFALTGFTGITVGTNYGISTADIIELDSEIY